MQTQTFKWAWVVINFWGIFGKYHPIHYYENEGTPNIFHFFLTNVGVLGGLFLVSKIHKQKKLVNIVFIGAGNTKNRKERRHLDHWDIFENWLKYEVGNSYQFQFSLD